MQLKQFVHKPTVVEALQWQGNTPFWRGQIKRVLPEIHFTSESNRRLIVCCEGDEGKHGQHKSFVLEHGDWLVNVRGQWCRVEKNLFAEIYQEATDED